LENELVIAQKELNSTRKEMEELKCEKSNETQECVDKIYDLQKTCNELMRFMEEENATHTKTKNDLRSKEEAIQRLHSDTIPNLQATIEAERDTVARLEQALELRRQEVDQANLDIERLQEKILSLQNQYDELQLNAQTAEENHQRIVEELANARLDMEKHDATEEQMKLQIAQLTDTNGELQKSNDSFVTQQKQLNDALEDAMVQLDQVENEKRTVEQSLKQALQQIDTIQKSLSLTNSEASEMIQKLSEQVNAERGLREEAETMRKELDTMVQSQKSEIVTLQQQVQLTIQERDVARNNMDGYNEREQKLYEQLQYYEHVRRDMHSKLIQLMGNIRVFIRIRPRLPHEEATNSNAVDALTTKKPRKDGSRKNGDEKVDEEIFRFPGLFDNSSHDDAIQKQSTARLATATRTNNIDASKNMIEVTAPYKYRGGLNDRRQQWTFGFDRVFAPAHSQNDIWEATDPLIQCAVDGYHVTVFAYGQTGSGVRALRNVIVVPNEIDVVDCEISPFFLVQFLVWCALRKRSQC
jgi:chromosome segregation ATPase